MDRSSRQKIKKEMVASNDTLDQIDLIDSIRAFHPKVVEYTFLLSANKTVSRIDHMLDRKAVLNKVKKIKFISNICSDSNGMQLEINPRKKKTLKNTQRCGG